MTEVYRYRFAPTVLLEDVECALVLALMGVESLHGQAQLCLDAAHYLDAAQHACVVDAGTQVGRDLNRLFIGFLRREISQDAFQVERVPAAKQHDLQPA